MAGKSFKTSFKFPHRDRNDLLKIFHDFHAKGVRCFRGRWLVANIAATDAARELGIPLDNPAIQALLATVIFRILKDLNLQTPGDDE